MSRKVSIIIPAYNAEAVIERCIRSVLDQTYPDFELIVLDDGSTDGTGEIIDRLAAEDELHRIVPVHKENSGVSDTRNRGLELASGEFVQFLDADDWAVPDATRLFVRAMEDNPSCDMVIGDFFRVVGSKQSVKGDIEEEKAITRLEYAQEMMRHPADFYYGVLWNKFYRRSIIEEFDLRMDTRLNWAEDFIFNMEYVLHTDQIYVLKAPVYHYVLTKGSLVTQGGLSIARTVRMKLNVIEYYSSFYKDIYTAGSYYLRSPAIYSFLLNFATDGGVGVTDPRLGQDRMDVRFSPRMENNPFVTNYYENRLLERALERLVNGTDLDRKDVQVLLYLRLAGGTASLNEISNFTGMSSRSVSGSVQKLKRRKIVEKIPAPKIKPQERAARRNLPAEAAKGQQDEIRQEKLPKPPVRIRFGEEAGSVQEKLDRVFRDVDDLQLRDFQEKEKEAYRRLSGKAALNVRKALAERVRTT